MSYSLHIDYREHKLKSYFKDINLVYNKKKVNVVIENLDLGDIVIKKNNKELLVIERKTLSDLHSSINDGRYKEQKKRLMENFISFQIVYLIENCNIDFIKKKFKYVESIITGSIINSTFRDNIKILRTNNIDDSINYIKTLVKKVITNPEFFLNIDHIENNNHTENNNQIENSNQMENKNQIENNNNAENGNNNENDNNAENGNDKKEIKLNNDNNKIIQTFLDTKKIDKEEIVKCVSETKSVKMVKIGNTEETTSYVDSVKIKKKDNNTPKNCNIIMLCQIPGVSVKIGKCILEHYKCISNIILEYEKLQTSLEKENMIKEIKYEINNNKKRKIGPVLSKRIYEYLMPKI